MFIHHLDAQCLTDECFISYCNTHLHAGANATVCQAKHHIYMKNGHRIADVINRGDKPSLPGYVFLSLAMGADKYP